MISISDDKYISRMNTLRNAKYEDFIEEKKRIEKLFGNFWIEIKELLEWLEKIFSIDYDKFENVNSTLYKLKTALHLCDFLRNEQLSDNQDTEKIIITTLVSLAEWTRRLNKPEEDSVDSLIKGFFKPVLNELQYKVKFSATSYKEWIAEKTYSPDQEEYIPIIILYLIRNDYIHNGNFFWVFFVDPADKEYSPHIPNWSTIYFSEKNNKAKLLSVWIECSLTYEEFLIIFLKAFKLNIEKYLASAPIKN